jgi:hypothetical protein
MTETQIDPDAVANTSLVEWPKPPTVEELKQDYQDALNIQKLHVSKVNGWLDNLNVTGSAKPKAKKGASSLQPKLIRKQAEWRYAALSEPFLSTDDVYNVRPVTSEDRKGARQNQLLLNHQLNTCIDKVRFIDEYVRTAVDEGTVIVQIGWCFEEEDYTETVPVFQYVVDPATAQLHEQLEELRTKDPSVYATNVPEELQQAHDLTMEQGQPIRPVDTGTTETVTKTRVVKNHPTLEVLDCRNVVFDPTCQGDIKRAGFAVKSFETCKADLMKYPGRYKNLAAVNVSGASILGTPDHAVSRDTQSFNFKDDLRAKFIAHEYHGKWDIDGTGKLVHIVATWVGDVLIRMEKAPVPKAGLPFVVEQYLPVRKSVYGEPDGVLIEDNQKVVGAVTRGMIDLMGRSANGQTGVRKDMLDATNRRKYQGGEDYEFNQNVDPRQGVFMHTYPEIPNSAGLMVQLQQNEADSLTGVQSFSQGMTGTALGEVAAGVRGALSAASKRELGILRRLSNGVIEIGRKLIAMNAELLSDEEVVRVTNEEFEPVRRDDLPGNYDLKLSISTAEEDDNQAQELAFVLQTIGPDEDPGIRRIILAEISRLRKMPDLAKKFEEYQPEPDPVALAMQQLAVKKAELEIADLEAQIAERQAKTQKTLVEAGLVDAKTKNLNSDTDLKNLDFVEQESGVTQERDLQRQGAQAQAQGQLAVVQHQLDLDKDDNKGRIDLLKEYVKAKSKEKAKN